MKTPPESRVFFHTGLPKAASTFLQRRFFPYLQGIRFVKKHRFKHFPDFAHSSERLLFSTELDLDYPAGREKIQRFTATFPNAAPILVLRRQESLLASRYKYYIRKNGRLSFEDFFDPDQDTGLISCRDMYYFPKISYLEECFSHPPMVILQEELKHAPFETMDMLANWLGVTYRKEQISLRPVNTSYSNRQLRAMRHFNRKVPARDHEHLPYLFKRMSKKLRGGLVHSVAGLSRFFPETGPEAGSAFIDPASLERIRECYEADWQQCLDYIQERRELLLPEEER